MIKEYKFKSHSLELPIKRQGEITCRVWESSQDSPSVVVLEYDVGNDLNASRIIELAEYIVAKHNMSVVVIEYFETKLRYSEELLNKLEDLLPTHLIKISKHLSTRHQKLIEIGAFQDVINDLQFNPYTNIPKNKDTIISLYGNENTYNDYGLVASLDVIYGLEQLKEIYSSWNWDDCIGVGEGYGSYILQLAERLLPNTFSLLIGKNSVLSPSCSDLFTNKTELTHGSKQYYYRKFIGKFPLYLNDIQGWTTSNSHPHFFDQRHYDIRNLEDEFLIYKAKRDTPRIFIEETIDGKVSEVNINFVEKLISNNYSVELFIADESEIDQKNVIRDNKDIKVRLEGFFDYYIENRYLRNTQNNEATDINILPVYNGVYILNRIPQLPKLIYIPSILEDIKEDEAYEYLYSYLKEDLKKVNEAKIKELIKTIQNPNQQQSENYIKMFSNA